MTNCVRKARDEGRTRFKSAFWQEHGLEYNIRQVQYNGLPNIQNHNFNNQTAIEILSHKLEVWNYEEEERVFIYDRQFINVKVKEIFLGRAMSNYDNGIIRDIVQKINPDIRIIRAENIMP